MARLESAMRARYLLVLLLGVALGRADKVWTGEARWTLASDTEKEITQILGEILDVRTDESFALKPPERGQVSPHRPALLKLRADALAVEAKALAATNAHPDTICHQYLLLYARLISDRAANLLLWHDLNQLPQDQIPRIAPVFTVPDYMKRAEQRVAQTTDVGNGCSEFHEPRW